MNTQTSITDREGKSKGQREKGFFIFNFFTFFFFASEKVN